MLKLLQDAAAMAMIADGILRLWRPKRHTWLWAFGPEPYQKAIEAFAERPGVTQAVAAGEIALGLLLARSAVD